MSKYHFECHTEECLLLNLGVQKDSIEHHIGRGQVCKILEQGKNLVGLIDEDPDAAHHPYYKKLYQNPQSDQHNIRFGFDQSANNRLIILKPKFEDWIIGVVSNAELNMSDYNLSNDPDILHKEIIHKQKMGDLQRLLHQLLKLENRAIAHLKKLLDN